MTDYHQPLKVFEEFMTRDKCRQLIDAYKDRVVKSTVVLADKTIRTDAGRTSSSYFLPDSDPNVREIKVRAALCAKMPLENVEGLQLVKYCKGEKYNYHYDYFVEPNPQYQRLHTFLIYLNDLEMEDGGSTSFKNLGVRVYPKAGRAIWFRDAKDDGTVLPETLHSGEEILTDKVKYAINVWIRNKKFG